MASWNMEKYFFNLKWKTLLVLDNATTHKANKAKDNIKECEAVFQVTPSGLTFKLSQ